MERSESCTRSNGHNFARELVCFVRQHQQKSLFTLTSGKISTNQWHYCLWLIGRIAQNAPHENSSNTNFSQLAVYFCSQSWLRPVVPDGVVTTGRTTGQSTSGRLSNSAWRCLRQVSWTWNRKYRCFWYIASYKPVLVCWYFRYGVFFFRALQLLRPVLVRIDSEAILGP